MQIGLRVGAAGLEVGTLQRVLTRAGFSVAASEESQQQFGSGTETALRAFQVSRGLAASGELNGPTLEALRMLEVHQGLTTPSGPFTFGDTGIDMRAGDRPSARAAPRPHPEGTPAIVRGRVVDADGRPVEGLRVTVSTVRIRVEQALGEATTDASGAYTIAYSRVQPAHLVVRALDASGTVRVESPIRFRATEEERIDLATSGASEVRGESLYSAFLKRSREQLQETPLESLREDGKQRELRFLAESADLDFRPVAWLHLAHRLMASMELRPETLFGLFSQQVPPSLDAALDAPGDSGLDDDFLGRIRASVLSQPEHILEQALRTAIASNILPSSQGDTLASELEKLRELRRLQVEARPLRGKTPLRDLLAAGAIPEPVRKTFVDRLARLGSTHAVWRDLKNDPSVDPQAQRKLRATTQAGMMLGGHLPLTAHVLAELDERKTSDLRALARLDREDWAQRLRKVDRDAAHIRPVFEEESAEERIQRIANRLEATFTRRFETVAFSARLRKARSSRVPARSELVDFLDAHPGFNLRRMHVDRFLRDKQAGLTEDTVHALKRVQRLFKLAPRHESVEALAAAGYGSAQSIFSKGRDAFVAEMAEPLGGPEKARELYDRAEGTYAAALTLFGQYNSAMTGIEPAAIGASAPSPDQFARALAGEDGAPETLTSATSLAALTTMSAFPTVQSLFGSLDFNECPDCRSVTSPAAYLVDLLQYLKARPASGVTALSVLLSRRPDLAHTVLSCANTEVPVPYIDLVNECLEEKVAPPPATPPILRDTVGSAEERRAMPFRIRQEAYDKTAVAPFPFTLPFDLQFAQTRAYLEGMGSSRNEVLRLLKGTTNGPVDATLVADTLGLNATAYALVSGTDTFTQWQRWGLDELANNLVHPKYPDDTTKNVTGTWTAALARVPILLHRTGLSLRELYQVLQVKFVTNHTVTVTPGKDSNGVILYDTDKITLGNLTASVLDRMQRFLRLWRATGLPMWELDWAIGRAGAGQLDAAFLNLLAPMLELRRALDLPLPQLLGFWYPLETRNVLSHLGEEDAVIPSPYDAVFRSPTLLAFSSVFPDVGAGQAFTANLSDEAAGSALAAALGLRPEDLALLTTQLPLPNLLSLDTVTTLFRYTRLASALKLTVPDLRRFIALTEKSPFTTPQDTLEFLRRLALLLETGLPVADLDYLLRHKTPERSTLAVTPEAVANVLADVRAALEKLAPAERSGSSAATQAAFVQKFAAAAGTTANIVSPVLTKAALFPLGSTVITELLARKGDGTYQYGPERFPKITESFTRVVKAAALVQVLKPTEPEFSFLVTRAADFAWQDPASLPTADTNTSRFTELETLFMALRLQRLQRARSPKLFDVLSGWLTTPPTGATGVSTARQALAPALNALLEDLTPLADAMGMSTVALHRDIRALTRLADALVYAQRYGLRATSLLLLGVPKPGKTAATDSARAARRALEARYTPSTWYGAVQPIEDALRVQRRDALVAWLLSPNPKAGTGLTTTEQLFGQLLIDPEMSACALTTRLKQAAASVQQFVQRCFLNLEPQVKVNESTDSGWRHWTWMKGYRLWEANRKVFLYPENYLLPELRQDKSSFFSDLESELLQKDVDSETAEEAYRGYLVKLLEVARLEVCSSYLETKRDGTQILHVFGRTRGAPARYFYRYRELLPGTTLGRWSAWEPLELDITGDHLIPVVWNNRLYLFWPTFTEKTEAVGDIPIPRMGGTAPQDTTASAPKKYWTVELSLSERRGGQWLPKRTYAEKMYVKPFVHPSQFTFKLWEGDPRNLWIDMYLSRVRPSTVGTYETVLWARARLSTPDAPPQISQVTGSLPTSVDASREPSYLTIQEPPTSPPGSLVQPSKYLYTGQHLGYSYTADGLLNWRTRLGAPVPLTVMRAAGANGVLASTSILGKILQPKITPSQQDRQFTSSSPFFVSDSAHTFFVVPRYSIVYGDASYSWQEVTSYAFSTFYHPFAPLLLRELDSGGFESLLSRGLQVNPVAARGGAAFDFTQTYAPSTTPWPWVNTVPVEDIDFTADGAYSVYNWELFFFGVQLIASRLMQNHRHEEALRWLQFVFDPTDASTYPVPQRYWRTKPFFQMQSADYQRQRIESLLALLAGGTSDPALLTAIVDWRNNPYDPHRVARLRPTAYQRATVMKYLDNLIAWGDKLFAQDTMESINEATQLYVMAALLLGPRPDRVRFPSVAAGTQTTLTYNTLGNVDEFSNILVGIENLVPAGTVPTGGAPLPKLLTGTGKTLFFCVPPNHALLAYWDTVADRLFKVRNCMNLSGVVRQLPLYEPPLDPLLLAKAAAAGVDISPALSAFQPVYRFATYLQKAVELANEVRTLGSLVLSAMEKKDAEALTRLRSGQEVDLLKKVREVRQQQVKEAEQALEGLRKQQQLVTLRRDYYRDIPFLNAYEGAALTLQAAATVSNTVAIGFDIAAGATSLIPATAIGAAGFGGTPTATVQYGGENFSRSSSSWASMARSIAIVLNEGAQMAGTLGGYQRRADEWALQRRLADKELEQLDKQLIAAELRVAIARKELSNHEQQLVHAQSVEAFLTDKYTGTELYDWMLGQLSTVHAQAYQLATNLAKRANAAYKYELGASDDFIRFGYWDGQRKGLLAAEGLLFDLRRMEASYFDANKRELELTRHISLALLQPLELLRLRQTGTCTVNLTEDLFDSTHPGHYFRRIKSVALTFPAVTGPYSGVSATLTLNSSSLRNTPTAGAALIDAGGAGERIATSSGQNDTGTFELNLRDERFLPFEGRGAVSSWTLTLAKEDNAFDVSTLSDVVMHLRYTARPGLDPTTVRNALKAKAGARAVLLDVTQAFGDSWYRFLTPDASAAVQTLSLPLSSEHFAYSALGSPKVSKLQLFVVLKQAPVAGTTLSVSLGQQSATPTTVQLAPGVTYGPAALVGELSPTSPVVPGPWVLTLAEASIPEALGMTVAGHRRLDPAKVEDVILVAHYQVA
ncbi:neuraminidase-like domain-containing protein [Corallococcus exercitus]